MAHLKEFLEAINYRITEGTDYQWTCFGANARYLDCQGPDLNQDYSISCVFDSQNQRVYQIEAWDYANDREYRWIDPEFREAHDQAARAHSFGLPNESMDGRTYIDLEVEEDILEKVSALVEGRAYDTRVRVPLDIPDDELLKFMLAAHERDMTFNQFVEQALKTAIDSYHADPEAFKQRAESWKREKDIL